MATSTQASAPLDSEYPGLDSPYPLTPEQVASFRENGHVLLRGVCTPEEVAAYRPALGEATRRMNREERSLEERDTYGKAFLQTQNLRFADNGAARFALARRFGKIAAELLGAEAVRLYHDQSLFKEPGGGATPWHQDQYYWPLDRMALGLWMPLHDVTEPMGILRFASGSHKEGFLGLHAISDESEQVYDELIRAREFPIVWDEMKVGDCTFHSGWTVHGAGPNRSDGIREVMTMTYYPDGSRVIAPAHELQDHERFLFLGGREPGQLADSEFNPVVYSRG